MQSWGLRKALAAAGVLCQHLCSWRGVGGSSVGIFPSIKQMCTVLKERAEFAESTSAGMLWVGEKVLPGIPDKA